MASGPVQRKGWRDSGFILFIMAGAPYSSIFETAGIGWFSAVYEGSGA
jgi:hypothetical protein